MHKGFAFIQFTNPFDARSACLGEDGRTVLGQTLGKSLFCLFCNNANFRNKRSFIGKFKKKCAYALVLLDTSSSS